MFEKVGLSAVGPFAWKDRDLPDEPGVYVIAVGDPENVRVGPPIKGIVSQAQLHMSRDLWKGDQQIVYIGRASTSLRGRLRQFYSHTFGKRSPHAGGQSILLLDAPLVIHCAVHPDALGAEHRLIEAFEKECNRKPFGNKVKAAQKKATAPLG